MDAHLIRNEYPAEKLNKFKADHAAGKHASWMAKFITEEIFDRYKGLVSGGHGNWTIARAINTGVMFPKAGMGMHAGDAESYDTFIDIYRPCVEAYHKGFVWDEEHAHRTDLDVNNLRLDFSPAAKSLILSTRIRVARNLGGTFVMNPNGTGETRKQVLELVRSAAANFEEDLQGTVYAHATMTPEEEQALIDDHFLFKVLRDSFLLENLLTLLFRVLTGSRHASSRLRVPRVLARRTRDISGQRQTVQYVD